MDADVVLKVEGLYKKFCRSLKRSMAYGSIDVTRNMLGINYDIGKLRKGEFWSLEDVNFELKRGETLGLVGANGSGKSTLLRLINGIYPPDRGKITVKGRMGALIAVGAGFHPHMTGRENILLNGTILGMTKKEIKSKMESIINFAEIGNFLDAPVSTYSSGMTVRLGFAIAIHSNPDIVLVDEILAVGDSKFQRKCLDKIVQMRQDGTSFVLVSHNMQNIEGMCSTAILLDHGKQLMIGTPKVVVPAYELLLQTGQKPQVTDTQVADLESSNLSLVKKYTDFGTDEIKVRSFCLEDINGQKTKHINSGEVVDLVIDIHSLLDIKKAKIWVSFIYTNDKEKEENNIVSLGATNDIDIPKGNEQIRISFKELNLTTGEYKVAFHIFDQTHTNPYTQGHYGYFTVINPVATLLRVGLSTPVYWGNPIYNISNKNNDEV